MRCSTTRSFARGLSALTLFIFLASAPSWLFAQDRLSLGMGLGAWLLPVESDFDADGVPADLYVDYEPLYLRVGVNRNASTAETTVSSTALSYALSNDVVYAAGRYPYALGDFQLFGMAGLAYINSTLEEPNVPLNESASATGYMLGAGGVYQMGAWGFGAQYVMFDATADLSTDVNVGSNQVLAVVSYSF